MKEGTNKRGPVQEKRSSTHVQSGRRIGAVVIGGHFQGLGILRSLGRQNVPVYLLDMGYCIGMYSRYVKRFLKCPDVRNHALSLEFLIDLARKENLKGWVLYPNDDETVCLLAKHKEQLEEYYRVTTPSWDVAKFAYDKMLTYQLAEQLNIPVPKTFCPKSVEEIEQLDLEYPVIIKPSIKVPFYSLTKKKAIQVINKKELVEEYVRAAKSIDTSQTLMVQELITGGSPNLFSVGSLCKNGEMLAKVVARRPRQHPMDFGHATTFAETVESPELEEMSKRILAAMNYSGLSEVEFMLDPKDGKYKLLEINARAWGWHTIAISAGVDLPYLSYMDMLGENVRQNGFAKGVKWVRITTDVPTVIIELLKGRMKFTEYLSSLKGKKEFAVMSLRDPIPFLLEIFMLPYLLRKKGF
jgi:D-aspartate ligase